MLDPSADALLDLLHPGWRALIAVCLLLVTILGVWRLAGRGPARMTSAMYVTGFLVVAITVVGAVVVSCSAPRGLQDGARRDHQNGEMPSPTR